MVITYLPKGDHDAKRLSSCGRPSAFLRTALLGEDGQPVAGRRARRDLRVRHPAGRRLLEPSRRDGGDVPRRLDAHRRRGPRGRGRLLVHRRPDQGHDRHRRLQRVPARGRGRRRRAPRGRPGRRDRHPAREVRRGGDRDRGAARRPRAHRRGGRRDPADGQGAQGLGAGAEGDHRHRRAAADRAGQAGQEGAPRAVLDGRAQRLASSVRRPHSGRAGRARARAAADRAPDRPLRDGVVHRGAGPRGDGGGRHRRVDGGVADLHAADAAGARLPGRRRRHDLQGPAARHRGAAAVHGLPLHRARPVARRVPPRPLRRADGRRADGGGLRRLDVPRHRGPDVRRHRGRDQPARRRSGRSTGRRAPRPTGTRTARGR